MNGRVLVVGNRFEDASWVNAAYGTAINVIYAENKLYRCGQLLNYGCAPDRAFQPSWYVQFLDNELREGRTSVETNGFLPKPERFDAPNAHITRCTIHRRTWVADDNSGGIAITGATRDVIVEDCVWQNPLSTLRIEASTKTCCFAITSLRNTSGRRIVFEYHAAWRKSASLATRRLTVRNADRQKYNVGSVAGLVLALASTINLPLFALIRSRAMIAPGCRRRRHLESWWFPSRTWPPERRARRRRRSG